MTAITQKLRLEGVYPQRQKEFFMQRVKLPAGILSAVQAQTVADIAERFARGVVHLTTRGSMELHWLTENDLAPVAKLLASVGLVSRGACGGAVRGVVCGSLGSAVSPELEALTRKLHRHFTGNPRFEKLPKKFKIGIESDPASRRHLIQDIGLLRCAEGCYDVFAAGGLGREPQPGFLLAPAVPEARLIPLIEAVLRVYQERTPPPKRLKHLVREIGADAVREAVLSDPAVAEELSTSVSLSASLVPSPQSDAQRLEARVFAGELSAGTLAALAEIAQKWCGGMVMITGDQNVALHLERDEDRALAQEALQGLGFGADTTAQRVSFRVCPGSHECVLGLAPTRDLALSLLEQMGPAAQEISWAISGCPNSCAQPQLAQAGVIVSRLVTEEGEKSPRFDFYRAGSGPFAEVVEERLSMEELLEAVRRVG